MLRSNIRLAVLFLVLVILAGFGYYFVNRLNAHADYITSTPSTPSSGVGLRIDPVSGSIFTGGNLDVDVLLDSPTQAISAVGVTIDYSSSLQYVSSVATNSVFNEAASTSGDSNGVSASNGVLTFQRLRFDTGYTGTGGEVIHLTFKALTAGNYTLQLVQNSSEVDVYGNGTNLLQTVNQASFTAQDQQVSATISAPYRSSLAGTGITVQFYTAGTTNLVTSTSTATSSSGGALSIADPTVTGALSNASSYDVKITYPGYLTRKVSGVTNILSNPFTLSSGQALIPGDFNGDNKITLSDLVIAIAAHNGLNNSETALAKLDYNGALTLSNLATLIAAYNTTPNGD